VAAYTISLADVTVALVWPFVCVCVCVCVCVHMTIIRVCLANTATHYAYKACGRQGHVKSNACHQNLCKVMLTFRLYLTTIHGYADVRLCPVPVPYPYPIRDGDDVI